MFMREDGIHIEFQSLQVVSSYQDHNNKIELKVNLKSFWFAQKFFSL